MDERALQEAFEKAWLKIFSHVDDGSGYFAKGPNGYASAATQGEYEFFKAGAALSIPEGREALPIETAPKGDGLLWLDGRWVQGYHADLLHHGPSWITRDGIVHPSHWAPLPEPPSTLQVQVRAGEEND